MNINGVNVTFESDVLVIIMVSLALVGATTIGVIVGKAGYWITGKVIEKIDELKMKKSLREEA